MEPVKTTAQKLFDLLNDWQNRELLRHRGIYVHHEENRPHDYRDYTYYFVYTRALIPQTMGYWAIQEKIEDMCLNSIIVALLSDKGRVDAERRTASIKEIEELYRCLVEELPEGMA